MELRQVFIDSLRSYRKERKISQMVLAELCDTSTSYIGEIEIGRKFPSVEMIQKIASALNIEAYKLFIEREKDTQKEISPELREKLLALKRDIEALV